ncbi:uncharacterized protein BDZ99DRAFT_22496 [Mytilinidion resinicola]|uniref:Uncharacterized protein n=1 Tax=Mytilinidion resinicola TaxID=574789 RepID=A0A6A6ZAC1_9PEZI|nr:uncharacterized protein BDZ99DRAFT_22496 [Mytilinidion resinicola]KAF2817683.1 hypothetical protein BDZ99DRAFT_22496 [Mytilinidion resinicola]
MEMEWVLACGLLGRPERLYPIFPWFLPRVIYFLLSCPAFARCVFLGGTLYLSIGSFTYDEILQVLFYILNLDSRFCANFA